MVPLGQNVTTQKKREQESKNKKTKKQTISAESEPVGQKRKHPAYLINPKPIHWMTGVLLDRKIIDH